MRSHHSAAVPHLLVCFSLCYRYTCDYFSRFISITPTGDKLIELRIDMGGHFSLPEDDLSELLEQTHFKKEDVKRWYKKFMKDYPSGQLNKEQFHEIYSTIYSTSFANHFAEHIFRSFDHNQDGYVSFKELILTLSVAISGTPREKLEWSFNVYDLDGDGRITLDEVFHVVKCMSTANNRRRNIFSGNGTTDSGNSSSLNTDAQLSTEEVEKMFKIVDKDSSGYWSLDEFIDGFQTHPVFVKMLHAAPVSNRQKRGGLPLRYGHT